MAEETCIIEGCNEPGEHSVSPEDLQLLEQHGYKVKEGHRKRKLCKKHYKELKKLKKPIERLEKWRMMGGP